jgi:hypothetical protein
VTVLNELTAIQADAIRATAAAHDRDPEELAVELMHLLAVDTTSEAIDATPAIPALTTDHDDTVRILLPWSEPP